MNDSRTLVLQIRTFVPDAFAAPAGPDSPLRTVARRQIAWCYCLGETLRGLNPRPPCAATAPARS